jgi:hypothetical protein
MAQSSKTSKTSQIPQTSQPYIPPHLRKPQINPNTIKQRIGSGPVYGNDIYDNIYYDDVYGLYKFIKYVPYYSTIEFDGNNNQGISSNSNSAMINFKLIDNPDNIKIESNRIPKILTDTTLVPSRSRIITILPTIIAQDLIHEREVYLRDLQYLPSTKGRQSKFDDFIIEKCDNDLASNVFMVPLNRGFDWQLNNLIQWRKKSLSKPNVKENFTLGICQEGSCIRRLLNDLSKIPYFTDFSVLFIEEPPSPDGKRYPNYSMSIPGGTRENNGETPYQCAVRECAEETGISYDLTPDEVNPEPYFAHFGIMYGQGIRYMGKMSTDFYIEIIPPGDYRIETNTNTLSYVTLKRTHVLLSIPH